MYIDTINLKDALKDTCALFRKYPHEKDLPQMNVQFTEACKAITGNTVEHPVLSLIGIYDRICSANAQNNSHTYEPEFEVRM